jgi:outer membrane protein assembly factor BamB
MRDKVVVWTFTTREAHYSRISSPVMAGQKLYFGSSDGYLYCVSAKTGQKEWAFPARGMVLASPALAGDTIYFACRGRFLYAVEEQKRPSAPNAVGVGR